MEDRIGDVLVEKGIISRQQLDRALDYQRSIGGKLGTILVKLRFVKEEQLTRLLADQQDISSVGIDDIQVTKELMGLIPREILEKHEVVPIKKEGGTLTVAMSDPTDFPTIEEIRFITGLAVEAVMMKRSDAQKVISRYFYGGAEDAAAASAAKRAKPGVHEAAREAQALGPRGAQQAPAAQGGSAGPGGPTIDDIDAPPGRLIKIAISMLVEKGIIDLKELKKRAES